MNMDGDTGSRATSIRSEIRGSLLDEWRFRAKQAWSEIDALQAENTRLLEQVSALSVELFRVARLPAVEREQAEALADALQATQGLLNEMHLPTQGHPPERCDKRTDFCFVSVIVDAALRAYRGES